MVSIRKYQSKDYDDIRHICWATAKEGLNKDRELLYTIACDYYINEEPENIFVATDESDRAVGYILCSIATKKHIKLYKRKYFKLLGKHGSKYVAAKRFYEFPFMWWVSHTWPAHLHIDILPEYQGMGLGRKLIETLADYLKSIGSNGLYLTVSADNESAVKFYRKVGFRQSLSMFGKGYLFTMKFGKGK